MPRQLLTYLVRFIERFDLFAARDGVVPFHFVAVDPHGLAAIRLGPGGNARTGGVVPPDFGGVHRQRLATGCGNARRGTARVSVLGHGSSSKQANTHCSEDRNSK